MANPNPPKFEVQAGDRPRLQPRRETGWLREGLHRRCLAAYRLFRARIGGSVSLREFRQVIQRNDARACDEALQALQTLGWIDAEPVREPDGRPSRRWRIIVYEITMPLDNMDTGFMVAALPSAARQPDHAWAIERQRAAWADAYLRIVGEAYPTPPKRVAQERRMLRRMMLRHGIDADRLRVVAQFYLQEWIAARERDGRRRLRKLALDVNRYGLHQREPFTLLTYLLLYDRLIRQVAAALTDCLDEGLRPIDPSLAGLDGAERELCRMRDAQRIRYSSKLSDEEKETLIKRLPYILGLEGRGAGRDLPAIPPPSPAPAPTRRPTRAGRRVIAKPATTPRRRIVRPPR
ncbi:MAG: hypothetical protein A2148_08495 [Chloroflexi bacterium RBG_16_68_14]|nr:MAG: hypothetical protein A2148_08495 [Chloroflexi bacterium RBG_16_68_14]